MHPAHKCYSCNNSTVDILTSISRINFMLNSVEHETSFGSDRFNNIYEQLEFHAQLC